MEFIIKDSRKFYKAICKTCGRDRGYKRPNKLIGNCESCCQIGTKDKHLFANVNFDDSIKEIGHHRKYRTNCIQCEKDKGYVGKGNFLSPCLSCTSKNRQQNLSDDAKRERDIKISCSHRGIDIGDFDGFTTIDNDLKRTIFKNKRLHIACFEKANYTCDKCNTYGVTFNAHHLNSWKYFPNERYDINNLVTICDNCHKDFHRTYGNGIKTPNTKEQYEEFKKGKQSLPP